MIQHLGNFAQKMLHIKMFKSWLCLAYQHDRACLHPLAHFGQKMLHIKLFEHWLCLAHQHDGKRLRPLVGDFAQILLFFINILNFGLDSVVQSTLKK